MQNKLHAGPSYVSSLTSLVKIIEVDPRVPRNRDEIPFPQPKQCSPELGSPSCQSSVRSFRKVQCLQEKPIRTSGFQGKKSLHRFFSIFLFSKKLISNSSLVKIIEVDPRVPRNRD